MQMLIMKMLGGNNTSAYSMYLLSRITAVEQHTRVQFRGNHTFKCQLWVLGEKCKRTKISETHNNQIEQNSWTLTVKIWSDLVILRKRYGVSLHVQDTGDGVALGKRGKRAD